MADEWEKVGEVGVDSAHVLIGDANYADSLKSDWHKRFLFNESYDFNHAPQTVSVFLGYAEGVVCVSGQGDGVYPVYVERSLGGLVKRMMIDFEVEDDDGND